MSEGSPGAEPLKFSEVPTPHISSETHLYFRFPKDMITAKSKHIKPQTTNT